MNTANVPATRAINVTIIPVEIVVPPLASVGLIVGANEAGLFERGRSLGAGEGPGVVTTTFVGAAVGESVSKSGDMVGVNVGATDVMEGAIVWPSIVGLDVKTI